MYSFLHSPELWICHLTAQSVEAPHQGWYWWCPLWFLCSIFNLWWQKQVFKSIQSLDKALTFMWKDDKDRCHQYHYTTSSIVRLVNGLVGLIMFLCLRNRNVNPSSGAFLIKQLYLVSLEEFDGSWNVKLAGHKKLDCCWLGHQPCTVRLFPATHLI